MTLQHAVVMEINTPKHQEEEGDDQEDEDKEEEEDADSSPHWYSC